MIKVTCKETSNGFIGKCEIHGSITQLETEMTTILRSFINDKQLIGALASAMNNTNDLLKENEEDNAE